MRCDARDSIMRKYSTNVHMKVELRESSSFNGGICCAKHQVYLVYNRDPGKRFPRLSIPTNVRRLHSGRHAAFIYIFAVAPG